MSFRGKFADENSVEEISNILRSQEKLGKNHLENKHKRKTLHQIL